METGEGLVIKEESKDIKLVRNFFPENADINKDTYGTYFVEATLGDHPICEGGQKISLSLNLVNMVDTEMVLENGQKVEPYVDLLVNSFLVNGKELKVPEVDFYLAGNIFERPNEEKSVFDCNLLENRDAFGLDNKAPAVFAGGIRSGISVAAYLHEIGHLMREDVDLNDDDDDSSAESAKSVSMMVKDDSFKEDNLTPKEVELYRMTIYEERRASLKALSILEKNKELFPNDQDLSKIKKTYSFLLSSYMQLRRAVRPDEISSIMDFDKDWHY
ncbi:MAG: hypothetical protein KIH89_001610 [Candidatus Shapirobacteria bacterium]|nr:hypothetical protein [Candidatus Shapirobacteria bacterium]